jgi:hypothetical protein
MNLDPFRPPSGWDTPEAPAEHDARRAGDGQWTIRGVLKGMIAAFRRRPIGVLVALCIVPGLWAVPATIAQDVLVGEDESLPGAHSFRAIAVDTVCWAWNSVWFAGQLSVAIDVVNGRPIDWRRFSKGLANAPILFATTLAVSIPYGLANFAPVAPDSAEADAVFWIVIAFTIWLLARTALWAPLIVDAKQRFGESFATSWTLTRGSAWRFFGLGLTLFCVGLPLLVVDVLYLREQFHLSGALVGALYALAVAEVYVITGAGGPRAQGGEVR